MALPLNVFQTITHIAPASLVGIYTAPVGYSGVVLSCQATNVDTTTHTVTLHHVRDTTETEIVKQMPIQGHDSMTLTQGKLVLESGDSLKLSASNANHVKFIASILETLN
mgnify:FL=1|tara:strand:+ start:25 stop:354 length:330 start_codon:yes stop_codon:yes gene_type:complete